MSTRTAQFDLRGKVVAITGGARGIGRGATGLALDVTDRASFESFLNEVAHRLGPLDVMVNNAGIQHVGLFADETDASTDIQIAVNLAGVLTGTKLALARMRPRGRGHVVNVASIGGKIASPGGATYSATKHAVVGLSESLRGELRGSGIAVSIVMPAIIATEMADGLGSARGVRRVEPTVVGEAIVRAVLRGRGADVYVPRYTGAINTAISVLPQRLRDVIHHLMRADTVLTDIDRSARAGYNTRVAAADKPHADGPDSAVQQP